MIDYAKGETAQNHCSCMTQTIPRQTVLRFILAHEHVNHIRDTIWFRTTTNIPNELGDLSEQTEADSWEHADS